jgi:DNA-binding NarL/FixJ family response regulator
VLVEDDHAPTREDVLRALEADPRFAVCGQAGDAASAIALAGRHRPDISLLDIRMPGGGLAALWEIRSRLPESKVVMLTASEEDEDLFAALRSGADGYLLKTIDLRRLPEALHDVARGRAAIPRELVTRMIDEFRGGDPRRRSLAPIDELQARLTSREWQVLDELARGRSTREVAERLLLSTSAVRAHITAIVRKLGVGGRDEAIEMFRESRGPPRSDI